MALLGRTGDRHKTRRLDYFYVVSFFVRREFRQLKHVRNSFSYGDYF